MRCKMSVLAVVAVLALGSGAFADVIALWDGVTTKNPGDTVTPIDDTFIHRLNASQNGTSNTLQLQTNSGPNPVKYILIGFKDLFTELPPATSGGGTLVVDDAALQLSTNGTPDGPVAVATLVTPWLLNAPGTNEINVTGEHSDLANTTTWAAGNFTTADLDVTGSTP